MSVLDTAPPCQFQQFLDSADRETAIMIRAYIEDCPDQARVIRNAALLAYFAGRTDGQVELVRLQRVSTDARETLDAIGAQS